MYPYPSQLVVHATLVKAHAIIGEHGHCKGRLQDEEGRVCIRGAINRAAVGDACVREWCRFGSPLNLLMDACERAMGLEGVNSLPDDHALDGASFNNLPDTTDEMILARLKFGIENTMPAPPPRHTLRIRVRTRMRGTRSHPNRDTFSAPTTPRVHEKAGVG